MNVSDICGYLLVLFNTLNSTGRYEFEFVKNFDFLLTFLYIDVGHCLNNPMFVSCFTDVYSIIRQPYGVKRQQTFVHSYTCVVDGEERSGPLNDGTGVGVDITRDVN